MQGSTAPAGDQAVDPNQSTLQLRSFFAWTSGLLAIALAVLAGFCWHEWANGFPHFAVSFPIGKDFINVYASSDLLLHDRLAELFEPSRYAAYLSRSWHHAIPPGQYVWSYPPSLLLVTAPFALLGYGPALAAWTVGTLGLYLGAARASGSRWSETAWLALAPASLINLYFGQNGFLIGGLIVLAATLRQRHPLRAGLLLGLASMKPHLLLTLGILLLAERRWRVIAAAAGTTLLLGIGTAIIAPTAWGAFFHVTLPLQRAFLAQMPATDRLPLWQLLAVSPFMAMRLLHASLSMAAAMQGLVALVVAGASWWAATAGRPEARLPVVLAGACLMSPYLMAYDLTLLSIACLLLARDVAGSADAMLLRLGWLAPLLALAMNGNGAPIVSLLVAGVLGVALRSSGLPVVSGRRQPVSDPLPGPIPPPG